MMKVIFGLNTLLTEGSPQNIKVIAEAMIEKTKLLKQVAGDGVLSLHVMVEFDGVLLLAHGDETPDFIEGWYYGIKHDRLQRARDRDLDI